MAAKSVHSSSTGAGVVEGAGGAGVVGSGGSCAEVVSGGSPAVVSRGSTAVVVGALSSHKDWDVFTETKSLFDSVSKSRNVSLSPDDPTSIFQVPADSRMKPAAAESSAPSDAHSENADAAYTARNPALVIE
eukprot:1885257-Rhodomonas_salina.1